MTYKKTVTSNIIHAKKNHALKNILKASKISKF